jgi:hypothetical protein
MEPLKYSRQAVDNSHYEGAIEAAPNDCAAQRECDDSENAHILGNIPMELAKVITKPEPCTESKHERRNRPPRPSCGRRSPKKRKKMDFIESRQLETLRKEFTENCMNLVFNAACIYHKLLN